MTISIKRVYDPAATNDGQRILVDRLWPRGLTKAAVNADLWLKEVAPSTALRQWFHHDPDQWPAFQARYLAELNDNQEALGPLRQAVAAGPVTLLFSAKDETRNHAIVLKGFLEQPGLGT